MWRATGYTLLKRAAGSRVRLDQFSRCGAAAPSLGRYLSATVSVDRSENGGDANTMSCEEAKSFMMRLVNVEAEKEKLGREEKEVIPYDELIGTCRKMGVAKSGEEAAAFAGVDDGIILLFRDKVYLQIEPNDLLHGH